MDVRRSVRTWGVVFSLALTACATGDGALVKQKNYADLQKYPVYVAAFDVAHSNAYDVSSFPQGFIPNPETMVVDFMKNRFQQAGSHGNLQIFVEDIVIAHKMTDSEGKVRAFMGVDRHDEYDVQVVLKLVATDVSNYQKQEIKVKGRRVVSISEHVSLAEREKAQMQAMDRMIDDLDVAVRNALTDKFGIMDARPPQSSGF